MSKPNDGGPAFPIPMTAWDDQLSDNRVVPWSEGMSLRAWLAGQALAGYAAWSPTGVTAESEPRAAAKFCVQHADAVIAELERVE